MLSTNKYGDHLQALRIVHTDITKLFVLVAIVEANNKKYTKEFIYKEVGGNKRTSSKIYCQSGLVVDSEQRYVRLCRLHQTTFRSGQVASGGVCVCVCVRAHVRTILSRLTHRQCETPCPLSSSCPPVHPHDLNLEYLSSSVTISLWLVDYK